jgi:hypothetical protein
VIISHAVGVEEMKEPEPKSVLVDLIRPYDDYFRHKENLAYTLLAAEVALFGAIAYAPFFPEWCTKLSEGLKTTALWGATVLHGLIIVGFIGLHRLLLFQLKMRHVAGCIGDGIRAFTLKWSAQKIEPSDLEYPDEARLTTLFKNMKVISDSDYLFPYLPQGVIAYVEEFHKEGRSRYFGNQLTIASWCVLIASVCTSLFKTAAVWLSS